MGGMDLVDEVDNLDEKAKALITTKPKLSTINSDSCR